MSARDEWRWADEQGVQRLVRIDELRAALSSKVLAPTTLVWREGMAEWLPAAKVPELAGGAVAAPQRAAPRRPIPGPPPLERPRRDTLLGIPESGAKAGAGGLPAANGAKRDARMPTIPGPPRMPLISAPKPPRASQGENDGTETFVLPDKPLRPAPPSHGQADAPRPAAVAQPVPAQRPALETVRGVAPPTRPRNSRPPQRPPLRSEPPHRASAAPVPDPVFAAATEPSAPVESPSSTLPLPPTFERPSAEAFAAHGAAAWAPPPASIHPQAPVGSSHPAAARADATGVNDLAPDGLPPTAVSMHPPPNAQSIPPFATLDDAPPRPQRIEDPVLVPLASLLGVGGFLVFALVFAFFVGRCSVDPEDQPTAMKGVARSALGVHGLIPEAPQPCWVVRQPVRWANEASKSIPFELVATPTGTLAMGYARDAEHAVGLEIMPATGEVAERFAREATGSIDRVSPEPGDALGFFVSAVEKDAQPRSLVSVAAKPPFFFVLDKGGVSMASSPTEAATPVWPMDGDDEPAAARALIAGEAGFPVTFRRRSAIWGAWLGPDRKPVGTLQMVPGSGGKVGKPMSGWNGNEVAVVFADQFEDKPWAIRLGHAPAGSLPTETSEIALPKGGPGGDAIAPDIAGLPDGRWLLVWTEGNAGARAIRAQTLAPDFTPLGDPIALSPPAGSFGQGVLGVAGGYVATVFLLKGPDTFELWGAMLKCG